jgi:hypothetical protein
MQDELKIKRSILEKLTPRVRKEITPVMQTRLSGKDGNCWPACLASIFNTTLEEVDECSNQYPDWHEKTDEFLATMGLTCFQIQPDQYGNYPFTATPDGTICCVGYKSEKGVPHVVVGKTRVVNEAGADILCFEIIHDPYPGGIPLGKILCVIFFVLRSLP